MIVYVFLNSTVYFTINVKHYTRIGLELFHAEECKRRRIIYLYPPELILAVFGRIPEKDEMCPFTPLWEERIEHYIIEEYKTSDGKIYLLLLYDREYGTYRMGFLVSDGFSMEKEGEFIRGLAKLAVYYYFTYENIRTELYLEELLDELNRFANEIKKIIEKNTKKSTRVFVAAPEILGFSI